MIISYYDSYGSDLFDLKFVYIFSVLSPGKEYAGDPQCVQPKPDISARHP